MLAGGKRLEGFKFENAAKKPIVSVITVVYNSEKFIERTILSVISQDYNNLELIVIDGGSKDNTVSILQKYNNKIHYWISEPDKGIYDAMNKGLYLAQGEYVWYINSGDEIYAPSTLSKIFELDWQNADVFYGETMMTTETGEETGLRRLKPSKNFNWRSLSNGMLVCHQSFIAKKKIASDYNLKYKVSADYEWVLKILKASNKIVNTNLILSKYLTEGMSRSNIKQSLKERFKIMREHYGLALTLFKHIGITLKFLTFLFRYRRF